MVQRDVGRALQIEHRGARSRARPADRGDAGLIEDIVKAADGDTRVTGVDDDVTGKRIGAQIDVDNVPCADWISAKQGRDGSLGMHRIETGVPGDARRGAGVPY